MASRSAQQYANPQTGDVGLTQVVGRSWIALCSMQKSALERWQPWLEETDFPPRSAAK